MFFNYFFFFYFSLILADFDDNTVEIQNILNDPVFISALDSTLGDCLQANQIAGNSTNKTNNVALDRQTGLRTIEKIRISLPTMASPSSVYSSSSESCSSIQIKKHKKRICIECNQRFKHSIEWYSHLKTHIRQPYVLLKPINENNSYYRDYLNRMDSLKRRASTDAGSLRITIKIPRRESNILDAISVPVEKTVMVDQSSLPSRDESIELPMVTRMIPTTDSSKVINNQLPHSKDECRIRVLRAEEIKQSPPSTPLKSDFPPNAMVSVPSENRIHYECPMLDGLNQFAEDAMNEESAAQLLKQLLETPSAPPETNDFVPNEFMSIDRLAHTCTACNQKFPDITFLKEHQRITGHSISTSLSTVPMILEPIQELSVDHNRQYHPPPHPSHLEQMLVQQKSQPPPSQQMPTYGQPRVLPLRQMENQVANFSNTMTSQTRLSAPPNYHLSSMMPQPPQHSMRNNNQPVNMTPFLEMNPDMYHPRQQNNGQNPFMRPPPNHMMNRFMQPGQPHAMLRFPNQHQFQQRSQMLPPQPNRELQPFGMRLSINQVPHPFQNQLRAHQMQFDSDTRIRDAENRPIISNAPRSDGLPVIESVQSGAIIMNATTKKNDISKPIQINDQITLSVKNKEQMKNKSIEKRNTSPTVNSTKVANILAHRGITVKPTGKLLEKSKTLDDSNKTPYATAEQAVQKLQMNNSVSIISKKMVTTPPVNQNPTIDLSNDDDTTISNDQKKKTNIKCPMKSCTMEFADVVSLRRHTRTQHQMPRFRCTICSTRFSTSEAIKIHLKKMHPNHTKPASNLGIPIVDFNDPNARKTMLTLGFTNFLPIGNTRNGSTELFGLPVVNIEGPSMNNLKNLFNNDATKIMPINSMRSIQKQKVSSQLNNSGQKSELIIKKSVTKSMENPMKLTASIT